MSADDSELPLAKVGHRQAPIQNPVSSQLTGFLLCGVAADSDYLLIWAKKSAETGLDAASFHDSSSLGGLAETLGAQRKTAITEKTNEGLLRIARRIARGNNRDHQNGLPEKGGAVSSRP